MNEPTTWIALGPLVLLLACLAASVTVAARIPQRRVARSWERYKRTGAGSVQQTGEAEYDETSGAIVPWRLRAVRDGLRALRYAPTEDEIKRYLKRHPDAGTDEVVENAGSLVFPSSWWTDGSPKRDVVVAYDEETKRQIKAPLRPGGRVIAQAGTILIRDESGATTRRTTPIAIRVLRGVKRTEYGTSIGVDTGIVDMTDARSPRNVPIWGDATPRPAIVGNRRIPRIGSLSNLTIADQTIGMVGSVSPDDAAQLSGKELGAEYLLSRARQSLESSAIERTERTIPAPRHVRLPGFFNGPATIIRATPVIVLSDVEKILDSLTARFKREAKESHADSEKRRKAVQDLNDVLALRTVEKAIRSGGKAVYVGRPAKVSPGRKTLAAGKDGGGWYIADGRESWHHGRYARVVTGYRPMERAQWVRVADERRGFDLRPVVDEAQIPLWETVDLLQEQSKAAIEWRRERIRRAYHARLIEAGVAAGTIPVARCPDCLGTPHVLPTTTKAATDMKKVVAQCPGKIWGERIKYVARDKHAMPPHLLRPEAREARQELAHEMGWV